MVCISLSHSYSRRSYQDIIFTLNGKGTDDGIDQPTLNHLKGIWKRVISIVGRLKMSEIEMTDDIVLIFEMTLQLAIGRKSFDIKNPNKSTRHSDSFDMTMKREFKEFEHTVASYTIHRKRNGAERNIMRPENRQVTERNIIKPVI
jgi:hypothetical protein